jgi:hypothetical protein
LIEAGCARSRFYEPVLSEPSTTSPYTLPPVTFVLSESRALPARAMRHAGAGNLDAALADLQRVRRLARLVDQGHMDINHVLAVAADMQVLRAYRGIFLHQDLATPQLARLRDEITSAPPLPSDDETTARIEYMLTLDSLMVVIRGDPQQFLALRAGEFFGPAKVDPGNLSQIDWNIALRAMNQYFMESNSSRNSSFHEVRRQLEANALRADSLKTPGDPLYDNANVGIPAVEAFLKKYPGESTADYSRRLGRWFLEGSPRANFKFYKVGRRADVESDLTLLALQLEQYRLAHRAYPDKLSDLGTDLPTDLFADAPFHYRRDPKGYTLWSVGIDGIDNNASGDDMVVKSEK